MAQVEREDRLGVGSLVLGAVVLSGENFVCGAVVSLFSNEFLLRKVFSLSMCLELTCRREPT